MINVFFVPGMFGSTVEHLIRCYTQEFVPTGATINNDGSMHSYQKLAHFVNLEQLQDFFSNIRDAQVTTPIYPFKNYHLPEILLEFKKYSKSEDKNILIYAENLRDCELNMLFQFHKIADPSGSIDIFCEDKTDNIKQWNTKYRHWAEMQDWELREWLSLFYEGWASEWIASQHQVPDDFLKIKNVDLLYNTEQTFFKIINHCTLHNNRPIEEFVTEWSSKQNYVLTEFNVIDQILDNTLAQKEFTWSPLTIIGEAIVQRRLREKNYEIQCNGLDIFPTNSKSLYKLLYNC